MTQTVRPDKHGLLSDPIPEVLRRLTIPMVFGMVAILMFNLVDTFFIALLGTQALAAVSFTFPVTFAINSITMGVGVGLSACIGRLLGSGSSQAAARVSSHGLLLALLLVILAVIAGLLTINPLFRLLGAEDSLLPIIHDYMEVWYLAIPLLVIPMAGNSAIRATGDAKSPAKIMMLAGVINGVLDPLLIFGYGPFPELGVRGAAISSGVSWAFALVWSLRILIVREKLLAIPDLRLIVADWRQILHIGTPAGLSNALAPLSNALVMVLLASQGTASVAAYGAAIRVESLLMLVMFALSSALMPFMAQNFGAKQPRRAFDALFTAMKFALGFQLLVFVMMVPLSWPISLMFSQDEAVQTQLWHYLILVPASYGLLAVCMQLINALNAMHLSFQALLWNLIRLFGLLLPAAWVGSRLNGTEGLFTGIAVANLLCGLAALGYARRLHRQHVSSGHQHDAGSSSRS